jgi:predicted alpha/beta-fold hydrolase
LAAALEYIAALTPNSETALVGFSLGGTIALNLVAELGTAACGNLRGLLAICSPTDLHSAKRKFDTPAGRPYDRHFVQALWQIALRRLRGHEKLRNFDWDRPPRRIREFDDRITAPLAGYDSADDYYTRTSPGPRLTEIRLPTTILAAADDPVVPSEPLENARHGNAVEVFITRHGGHLGFIGRRGDDLDRRWMDWRVVDWVLQTVGRRALCTVSARQTAL